MSTNDVTGDKLITKTNTDAYRDNYDRIFSKKARTIFYWPDNTWCDRCDLPYMTHLGDDFGTAEVSYDTDDEKIDFIVRNLNNLYMVK